MGTLWRSEDMSLVQIFVQLEAARDTLDELGELGVVQFRDLNPDVNAFHRNFITEVQRATTMERQVQFLKDQLDAEGDNLAEELDFITVDSVDNDLSTYEIEELGTHFEELEKELVQLNQNREMLQRNYNELVELKHVLMKDSEFFTEVVDGRGDDDEETFGGGEEAQGSSYVRGLGFVTGVLPRDKMVSFERVLWRATRGNLFMKTASIHEKVRDPHNGHLIEKTVFIIFFQGGRAQQKIKKICESYGANLYPCPDSAAERAALLDQVMERKTDLTAVINRSQEHKKRLLLKIAGKVDGWMERVVKEKAIYHTMNMFLYDVGRRCLIGEGWVPTDSLPELQDRLDIAKERSGAVVPSVVNTISSRDQPPTYFKTNKFTSGYQGIVDSYGIARYKEVNPAVFTIISFPYLFGIMFGDAGHGTLMFLFAAWMVFNEKKFLKTKNNEIFEMLFGGRYILLLMGVFAIYNGILYNEFFAVSIDFFGTRWRFKDSFNNGTIAEFEPNEGWGLGIAYPFGVDPIWKGKKNELTYTNSLKMKISVIFGVTQMCLGICLKCFNGIHFREKYTVLFEFIPEILFMLCTFGYMNFLIIWKWLHHYPDPAKAPSILNLMIDMYLSPYELKSEDKLYEGQFYVQIFLILIILVCLPTLLCCKPCCLFCDHKKEKLKLKHRKVEYIGSEQAGYSSSTAPLLGGGDKLRDSEDEGEGDGKPMDDETSSTTSSASSLSSLGDGDEHDEEEFEFSEIFVHQIIHTIEFVLGAISNTASYLRLWALSLAHAELAVVFWNLVLVQTLKFADILPLGPAQFIAIFCGFAVWAALTFGVLLIMEALSSFLHALRLHWVEFQNKFYEGDGYAFVPFSYERMLSGVDEEE